VGLDIAADVRDTLNGLSPEGSPTPDRLRGMVSQGHFGRKSGKAFIFTLIRNAVPQPIARRRVPRRYPS